MKITAYLAPKDLDRLDIRVPRHVSGFLVIFQKTDYLKTEEVWMSGGLNGRSRERTAACE